METVYLANGQECFLIETIGKKHIVRKIYEYEDDEFGAVQVQDTGDVVVDEIFVSRPVEKIATEIKELVAELESLANAISASRAEHRKLMHECAALTKTQIDEQKFIINRTEWKSAKNLVLFPKDSVMPITSERSGGYNGGLKLSVTISIWDGKQDAWGYKIYKDSRDDYGTYLCPKYGILIDPTQEEIDATIRKRLAEIKWEGRELARVDDKYLSETQLETKQAHLIQVREQKQVALRRDIAKLQADLARYTEQLTEAD